MHRIRHHILLAIIYSAACTNMDYGPAPDLRIVDSEGMSEIIYDTEAFVINSGEAVKVEVLVNDSKLMSEREMGSDELHVGPEDEDVIGVIPHWKNGIWIIFGRQAGNAAITIAGGRFEVEVAD